MIEQLGTVTLDADTFDMVKLVAAGNTRPGPAKAENPAGTAKRADRDHQAR